MTRRGHLRSLPTSARDIEIALQGRKPPQNLEAEGAVIGSVILRPEALHDVRDLLAPSDFFAQTNGWIWEAICALYDAGSPIDVIVLATELERAGRLQRIGGREYLMTLMHEVPSVAGANLLSHIEIIREEARQRAYIQELWRQLHEAYDPPGPRVVWRDMGAAAFTELADTAPRSTSVTLGEGMLRAAQQLEQRRQGEVMGLPTGFAELDRAVAGLHPREVTLLGGPTGRGKTSFALCLALNVASNPRVAETGERVERGVLFFCVDNMTPEELGTRAACTRGRVDSMRLKTDEAIHDDWNRFTRGREELSRLPVLLECHAALTPIGLRAKVRAGKAELRKKFGAELALVVVDYFQLLGADGDTDGMNQEQILNRNAKSVLLTAGLFNVPILMLIQLNNQGEVRDCSAAAMHAQNRWTLTWKNAERRAGPPGMHARPTAHPATVRIEKSRNGRLGAECHTNFVKEWTLFTDEAV